MALANDSEYGLAAGIHTKDYERAIRVTSALKAGTTWVNCTWKSFLTLRLPHCNLADA